MELELTKEQWEKLKPATQAEWSRFVLKALISYHERITMGGHPDLECWKRGLEFAVSCVQKEIDKDGGEVNGQKVIPSDDGKEHGRRD